MADEGVYLFCFCRPGATVDIASQVEERTFGSVAAVCARVPLTDFTGPQAEEHLRDPVWVVQKAFAHERVIETVATHSPVLPLHFGTIFTGYEALVEMLSRHHQTISRFLDEIVGVHEWAVRVSLDIHQAEDWLLARDPELAEKYQQLPQSSGTRYFREKQLRLDARKRIKKLGAQLAEHLREQMRQTGLPTVFLPPTGSKEAGQEMIFHAVCLIPVCRFEAVQKRFLEIGDDHREQGAILTTSGPWPPYHFCPALEKSA